MTDESVFAAALAIPRPSDRAAYLEKVCAGNLALRREVDALLSAHAADNLLDRPPADLAATGDHEATDAGPSAAAVGDRIGPYRLMEQIGEGGFGLVFVAEQAEPVRRKVALKVLKPGMDTRDVVARFEAERQALALMDHPNIARVLDAGSTPSGRPYFVMELVRGVPITDYCDAHKLAPNERLPLFVHVCQAVQHAHQKGVIHRDIKPSNVLVTMIDGKPVPKVIDFGVAKAVGQSLTEKTVYTRFAQILGTPLYMSPEQAEMSGVDVDTRTDVYALGVLLYELLTGTTPFDRDRFRKAAFDEIRRIIREEDPPRPSTRLSSLGPTLTDVSAQRATDPGKLPGLVRGELDWIVMKSLEKDRNRRYETANGLARDVQRFLDGDAVEACPPTVGYRLRKLYRRNRAAVWVGALVLGLTYAGASGIYFAYRRAVQAEARLAEQRDMALASEHLAIAATQEAAKERDKVAGANSSLRELADRQRRTLYASQMNLAQAAWESGDTRRTLELVRQWVPKPGEEDLRGFEWHYWNRQAHQELQTVRLDGLDANSQEWLIAMPSPDGSGIAAMVEDPGKTSRTLRLWDAATGRLRWTVPAPPRTTTSIGPSSCFSADGQRLMRFSDLGTESSEISVLGVWETASGRLLSETCISTGGPFWASFSGDGSLVAIAGHGGSSSNSVHDVRVMRVSDQREIARFTVKGGRYIQLVQASLSPDGKRIALYEQPGDLEPARMRVVELDRLREVWTAKMSEKEWIGESRFTNDGARILVRCGDDHGERVHVHDGGDGRRLRTISIPRPGDVADRHALYVSGTRCAIAKGKVAYVFDIDRPDDAVREFRAHEYSLSGVAFLPDGSRLVTVDEGGVVKEWNLARRSPRLKTPLVEWGGTSVLLTPDGAHVVFVPVGREDQPAGRLKITDGTGRPPVEIGGRLPEGHPHRVSISFDSRNLASLWHSGKNHTFIVSDLTDGRERLRKALGPGDWNGGAMTPDGSHAAFLTDRIVSSSYPSRYQEIRIYELATGKESRAWKDPVARSSYRGGRYSPDGRWLVIERFRGDDHRLVWMDTETMTERASIRVDRPFAEAVFSRDGRQVAIQGTASPAGGIVEVWAVESLLQGESRGPVFRATGLAGTLMNDCEFSPDGHRLLTSSQGTVKLWDTTTGGEILTLKAIGNTAVHAHFSFDGQKIWAGLDEENRFWGWDATPLDDKVSAP